MLLGDGGGFGVVVVIILDGLSEGEVEIVVAELCEGVDVGFLLG
jgi:hypothetical protein